MTVAKMVAWSPRLRARSCGCARDCEGFSVSLAVLALIGVGGCSASGLEPSFETAYSAVGAQVK